MKIGIFFTGTGPLLILTSYDSLTNPKFLSKLSAKGIKKFIAFEVSEEMVKERYGLHYQIALNDEQQEDEARVIDFDGHQIFNHFNLKDLGEPIFYEGEG